MKILVVDCESNGLHGYIFAIGAVVLDTETLMQTRFTGRVDIVRDFGVHQGHSIDKWVVDNVLPHIKDLDLYTTLGEMYDEFWDWFQVHKQDALVFADFGYPVEARFFQYLQNQAKSREWTGPYPLHELGTLLLAVGADPDKTNRREWYADMPEFGGSPAILYQHNPLDDALAAGWCVIKALRLLKVIPTLEVK